MEKNASIAVVEDEDYVRELISLSLTGLSSDIQSFASASQAWEHIRSNDADIVISDVNMPGMSGFSLLRKIKEEFANKRCILISADPSNEGHARKLGADAFLAKPFRMKELLRIVHSFV